MKKERIKVPSPQEFYRQYTYHGLGGECESHDNNNNNSSNNINSNHSNSKIDKTGTDATISKITSTSIEQDWVDGTGTKESMCA